MAVCNPAVIEPLKLGSLGPAYRLILNAPQRRNALGQAMVECLRDCVQQLSELAPWDCRGVIMESQVEGERVSHIHAGRSVECFGVSV